MPLSIQVMYLPDMAKNLQFLLSKYVTLSFSKELRDRLHGSNVLRLSAGMNKNLIAKFGRKAKKSKSDGNLKALLEQEEDDKPTRGLSAGNGAKKTLLPPIQSPNVSFSSSSGTGNKSPTTPKASGLGLRRKRRGKDSPASKPLKVENTKFKGRGESGALGGIVAGKRRRNRSSSTRKRRVQSVTGDVQVDEDLFAKEIELARRNFTSTKSVLKKQEETNNDDHMVEKEDKHDGEYKVEHLLPDMPDLSDDEKEKDNKKEGGKEVENVEDEVKTKSSPTNKYVVQMVNEVLENSSPDGKKT